MGAIDREEQVLSAADFDGAKIGRPGQVDVRLCDGLVVALQAMTTTVKLMVLPY